MLPLMIKLIIFGTFLLLCLPLAKAYGGDDATVIANAQIPLTMVAGHGYQVSITLKNTGTTIWLSTVDSPQSTYCLADGATQSGVWGLAKVQLPRSVFPGELQELNFSINAPTVPGTYHFQWRMYQSIVGFFGDATSDVVITVSSPSPTRISAITAIQTASTFCQKVGSPVSVQGTAEYIVPLPSNSLDHWQPYWDVIFLGQAEIKVVDATSVIAEYNYLSLGDARGSNPPIAGTAISQSDALQRATTALQATGQTDDLSTSPYITEDQLHDPPLSITHYWSISWQRQFQGIPYRGQSANVMLQAETGQLLELALVYPSPPPLNNSAVIGQVQAQTTASTFISGQGIQNIVLNSSRKEIVQANSFWQDGNEDAQSNAAKVAWVV